MTEKEALRRILRSRRKELTHDQVEAASLGITAKLMREIDWGLVENLHCYLPIVNENEVNTAMILDWIFSNYPMINIYTPASSRKQSVITSFEISEAMDLKKLDHGSQIEFGPNQKHYDVILVPLVAFDDEGNRLGFGAAAYDKFLKLQPKAQKVGLAFDMQRVEEMPVEKHDVSLDMVITEDKVYDFK